MAGGHVIHGCAGAKHVALGHGVPEHGLGCLVACGAVADALPGADRHGRTKVTNLRDEMASVDGVVVATCSGGGGGGTTGKVRCTASGSGGVGVGDEDVAGLDVAVDQAVLVQVHDASGNAPGEIPHLRQWQ